MSVKYPGLVIGGPLDGKLVERTQPMFQVVLTAPFGQDIDNPAYRPYTYRFVPTPHGVQFWFGEDVDPTIAMQRLALIYSEAANAVSG